jgi:hypothetical protein
MGMGMWKTGFCAKPIVEKARPATTKSQNLITFTGLIIFLDKIGYLTPKLKQSQDKAGNKNIKKNPLKTKSVNKKRHLAAKMQKRGQLRNFTF